MNQKNVDTPPPEGGGFSYFTKPSGQFHEGSARTQGRIAPTGESIAYSEKGVKRAFIPRLKGEVFPPR